MYVCYTILIIMIVMERSYDPPKGPPSSAGPGVPASEAKVAKGPKKESWFTARSALKVYSNMHIISPSMSPYVCDDDLSWIFDLIGQYIGLDSDRNGMLSKKEFSRFQKSTLTPVMVDRLWQECRMYRNKNTGEMEMVYRFTRTSYHTISLISIEIMAYYGWVDASLVH